jgi:cell fate regulator YaaT (PSP1 superfamily)
MAHSYLIRYGLMGRVGRFWSESAGLERGQTVVIRSHRGTELGEVLVPAPAGPSTELTPEPASTRIVRVATAADHERARQAEHDRAERFERCRRVFEDGVWPLELIDVEPLLDDCRVVLHYLGPHRLDVSGLLATLRATCDLDVIFEPVGRDVDAGELEQPEPDHGAAGSCGQCGSGSSGGGCGSGEGGCSECGVKKLLAARRPVAAG